MNRWRLTIVMFVFAGFYFYLMYNLYDLQINENKTYAAKVENQQLASGYLEPSRGSIYFIDSRNDKPTPAVFNKNFPLIYAAPKEIEDVKEAVNYLSPILKISASDLEKKLNKPGDQYEVLFFKAPESQVSAVKKLNLKGIYVKEEMSRNYQFGSMASNVLGYVGPITDAESSDQWPNQKGFYGIESFFDKELSGEAGGIKDDKLTPVLDGKDLTLTIDFNIQDEAEKILKKTIDQWGAESGNVIVQDPYTGKILAMGNFPNFDPNNYSQSSIKNFLNTNVQAVYEPGSVFKIITMSAGIDSGKITPDTTYVDPGFAVINGRRVENWDFRQNGAHGTQTMTNVIEHSINTGSIFAEKQTGHETFYNYLVDFGFDDLTGIKLPGEVKGSLNNLKKGKDIEYATASYGQGVSVTPIELISAFSAVANGGVLMKPVILNDDQPEVVRRVISKDTAGKVVQMMVSAVEKNFLAAIPNYNVAGKTGTAFVPEKGGYSDDVINTYMGFAPAFNPKFIILIRVDKPKNAPLAGQTVVPAFRELTEFLLRYYNIAPDNLH